MNYYNIKDLETLSGIKAHTIRIWEKRYGLLEPQRSTTNIRYYSDNELRKLLNVSMLVKHGYKISKVSNYENGQIQKEVLKLNEKSLPSESMIDQLVMHMVNFDHKSLEDLLLQQINKIGFEETFMENIFPLFEKVGIYWQIGTIFPAQEHFVSNIIRELLIKESSGINNNNSTSTVLFFLKEGEMHEISLLFYHYLALKSGYKTIYLGQNVPFEDLAKMDGVQQFDRIFTAFINGIDEKELENYIAEMHKTFKGKKIFVTGAQISVVKSKLPSNFKLITDTKAFKKYFSSGL
ncbi:MerR family transcriptional regulator [uncultured Sunxiuqinia sp.]|uniref:MerR family transcriptional regulator n=1 Tax=uncultured Sunxiuqinia sp. TaxID=1573825 RepID=UPI002AA893D3|nr:MerR family transcriptional regulator [uncultured Sunxiuqinia sp.]